MGWVGIHMDAEDATSTSKLVVDGAEIDFLDAELTQHGSTHDTRLDSDIESGIGDQGTVDSWGWVEFLSIGIDVAVLGVDITPILFGVGSMGVGSVDLLAGTLVFRLLLRLLLLRRPVLHLVRCLLLHVRLRSVGKKRGQGHQLRMAGAVAGDVGGVHASGDDSAIMDEDTADRRLVGLQRQAGLQTNGSVY